jgi:hypothetical protein
MKHVKQVKQYIENKLFNNVKTGKIVLYTILVLIAYA